VLLVDELDRADDEFEAFLLEILSEFAVTIPEVGRVAAARPPAVVVTSNRTRELHDALKRRCLYHWIDHPDLDREVAIVRARAPQVPERLAREVAAAVERLRRLDLAKAPGVAETIDWASALAFLGAARLTPALAADTLGAVIKDHEDRELVVERLAEVVGDG
jgi:MoxR-like ATPase